MARKATTITLSPEDRNYFEQQVRARTIQAQTVRQLPGQESCCLRQTAIQLMTLRIK